MIRHPDNKPHPPLNRDIFSMGACVRVDPSSTSQGGVGFVSAVHTEERKVDVEYNENSIGVIKLSPFIKMREDFILMFMIHLMVVLLKVVVVVLNLGKEQQ
ncbi:MAG: hypothetical protein ACI90V_004241 [Bacillariaceae sp.]|jgi:hypothetical protein